MTVRNIFDYLNKLFPCETACDFDNVGLLVGDYDAKVEKALICLDCTPHVLEKAKSETCQLIITHHPIIFAPLKSLKSGDLRYELIKNNISVISMHTNMDIADMGVNDCLCKALSLENIEPYVASDGFLLRKGKLSSPLSAEKFASFIKTALGGSVKYVDGGKLIKNVLVCSGSGGEFIEDVQTSGADALVTAEIKHHQFLRADELGISAFDAGHFNTEDVVVEPLKNLLQNKFADITFLTDHFSRIAVV